MSSTILAAVVVGGFRHPHGNYMACAIVRRMGRRRAEPAPVFNPEDFDGDQITEDEERQAAAGTLLLVGPEFESVRWSIHRYRTREEMASDPRGEKTEWVHDCTGEIDGGALVDKIGGGTFNFRGYVPRMEGGGVKLKYSRIASLAGPRKDFTYVPPPVPVQNGSLSVPEGDATAKLLKLMIREQRESRDLFTRALERLAQPQAGSTDLISLVTALKTLDDIRGGNGAASATNPHEMAKTMLEAFHQGVNIGSGRPPDEDAPGINYGPIIEKGLDIVGNMFAGARATRRPPMTHAVPPRPAEPSTAEVVNDGAPAPPPEPTSPGHRWTAAMEALYRAMLHGKDPGDFAASLEDILNADEVGMLRQANADMVIDHPELQAVIGGFPQLRTPQGRTYLDAVLNALREDDGPDEVTN